MNRSAVEDLLLSEPFRNITNEAARDVGEKAGGRRKGVIVDEYTTDRTAAAVKVPAARQAKSGALTRAAAAAGLEVRAR
ncbi:hypothetical protein GQ85_18205 [Rhodococcus rhodochrous]|nr:hypothetical protein GQ85_18205 [Rhodococcus rhodochrous]